MDYVIKSEYWPHQPTINVDSARFVRDQEFGAIVPDTVDVDITLIEMDGTEVTIPFSATSFDDMDYGRQLYADLMDPESKVMTLKIAEADPWEGPYPEPEPDPRDVKIADLERKVDSLETIIEERLSALENGD